ncbi:STAS domain-containing protein [Saccharopolyspora sp. MS10]|uniref:STAS domain-containing protein n=1 Tax=Saccharopolyspora sp. MS10 TaxID=3385973 RepID=UPI0039A22E98
MTTDANDERSIGAETALRPTGEIDFESAPRFEERMRARLDLADGDVVVDLTEVPFIDSSGLAVLVRAHQRASAQHRRVLLTGVGPSIRRTFDITGLTGVLHLADRPSR